MLTKRNTRVLVTSSPLMLGEVVQSELRQIQGLRVKCSGGLNVELLTEIEAFEADIVVILDSEGKVPGIVSHIFDNFPGVVVVVFNSEKRQAVLCQRSISQEPIANKTLTDLIQFVSNRETLNYWGVGNG